MNLRFHRNPRLRLTTTTAGIERNRAAANKLRHIARSCSGSGRLQNVWLRNIKNWSTHTPHAMIAIHVSRVTERIASHMKPSASNAAATPTAFATNMLGPSHQSATAGTANAIGPYMCA